MNTAIITEKSVRKAQDNFLADSVDKLSTQMTAMQDKLRLQTDTDGTLLSTDKKQAVKIDELTKDLTDLKEQAKTL